MAAVEQFGIRPPSVRGPCRTDAGFCIEALKDALARYGPQDIFNSDQGSQFTSTDFTQVLRDAEVKISMDGRGRWIDNRMIERLWRSLKYECVYLNAFETGSEVRRAIGAWLSYYNEKRPHSSHGPLTRQRPVILKTRT